MFLCIGHIDHKRIHDSNVMNLSLREEPFLNKLSSLYAQKNQHTHSDVQGNKNTNKIVLRQQCVEIMDCDSMSH